MSSYSSDIESYRSDSDSEDRKDHKDHKSHKGNKNKRSHRDHCKECDRKQSKCHCKKDKCDSMECFSSVSITPEIIASLCTCRSSCCDRRDYCDRDSCRNHCYNDCYRKFCFLPSLVARCGVKSIGLDVKANPNPYVVGDEVTFTYTITNTGSMNLYGPVQVYDSMFGTRYVQVFLAPNQTSIFTRTNKLTTAGPIAFTASAYFLVDDCKKDILYSPTVNLTLTN